MHMKTNEIQIRDPFILTHDGYYYLYGSTDKDIWTTGFGFEAYRGKDLTNWEPLGNVFDRPQGYWGKVNFWAPEVHEYKGKFYMFASFKDSGVCRGTAVLKADRPEGPFRPWSERALTPKDWECLDGTLHVENGKPYLVFCHEWVQIGDGTICAMPLTDDLSAPAGEPVMLFHASEATGWIKALHNTHGWETAYVTDGPNMYRAQDGTLYLLWSSFCETGYAISAARSASGSIAGPWIQEETPLFGKDGGHGMIFTAFDGQKYLTIHTPNKTPLERAIFIPLWEKDGKLTTEE